MKKVKRIISLFLVIALVFMTVGCSSQNAGTSAETSNATSTLKKIQDRGKLIIGTGPGYLPFEMLDQQGNFIGYDMDLGRAIGEALNVEVEFVQYEFITLIPALQNGQIDMLISGMTIRGDRALAVSFSDPYYPTGQVLMINANDKTTKSWKDLDVSGNIIAVTQGSTGALLAKQIFKNATVRDYEGFPTASQAVAQGMANGLIYDEPAIKMYEIMHPENVKGIYELVSSENLGIAVAYNDLETVQWLNSFLSYYIGSPEELESREKWFNSTDWMEKLQE